MSKESRRTFKAGDRVWCALTRKWATLRVTPESDVFDVDGWSYDQFGRLYGKDSFPLLFRNEIKPEDWPQPPALLTESQPVMVRDFPDLEWQPARFARFEDDKICCYACGDSWTSGGHYVAWEYWRLPTLEELRDVAPVSLSCQEESKPCAEGSTAYTDDYVSTEALGVKLNMYRAPQDRALIVELESAHDDVLPLRVYADEQCLFETKPFPDAE